MSVHRRLLDAHSGTVEAVIDAGRTVASAWPGAVATDSRAVVGPLERVLGQRGVAVDLLAVLDTATAAIDDSIRGSPVPAPPYLAITSRGPICRGTLAGGGRVVVEFEVFGVERHPPRYRFLDPDPATCLSVSIRGRD